MQVQNACMGGKKLMVLTKNGRLYANKGDFVSVNLRVHVHLIFLAVFFKMLITDFMKERKKANCTFRI